MNRAGSSRPLRATNESAGQRLNRRRLVQGFTGLWGAFAFGCARRGGGDASNVVNPAAGGPPAGGLSQAPSMVEPGPSVLDTPTDIVAAANGTGAAEKQAAGANARTGTATTAGAEPTAGSTEASAPTGEGQAKAIYLQPLGDALEAAELEYIEAALALYFPFPVRRLPSEALPADAYYAPRKRYRAERLLDHLEARTPTDAQVVIGLTTADISTTKGQIYDWGILGLATISGQQCVISRFRAQRGAKDARHVRQRLAKTVVHEVGHTIGLPHCPNHGCVMEDGKGSVLTTDHERDVCADCRARVGRLMLPVPVTLPWD